MPPNPLDNKISLGATQRSKTPMNPDAKAFTPRSGNSNQDTLQQQENTHFIFFPPGYSLHFRIWRSSLAPPCIVYDRTCRYCTRYPAPQYIVWCKYWPPLKQDLHMITYLRTPIENCFVYDPVGEWDGGTCYLKCRHEEEVEEYMAQDEESIG